MQSYQSEFYAKSNRSVPMEEAIVSKKSQGSGVQPQSYSVLTQGESWLARDQ
jgi:hypothetical protein